MIPYSIWISISPPSRLVPTEIQLFQKVQEASNSETALEKAGALLAKLGGKVFKTRNVTLMPLGLNALELYDPSSEMGVVVMGLTVVEDSEQEFLEDSVQWRGDSQRESFKQPTVVC